MAFTGLAEAALIEWKLTERIVIISAIMPEMVKVIHPRVIW